MMEAHHGHAQAQQRMAFARREVQSDSAVVTASQAPPAGFPLAPRERSQGDGCNVVCTAHGLSMECLESDG